MAMSLPLLCLISFFSFFLFSSHATDTLASSDNSGDNQTLVSSECGDHGANFTKMTGSLPSTSGVSVSSIGISDCQTLCKANCSCAGFASLQNESTCQLYYGSKQNLLKIIEKGAGLIYIRDRASSGKSNQNSGTPFLKFQTGNKNEFKINEHIYNNNNKKHRKENITKNV